MTSEAPRTPAIRPRERDAILQSLRAGVVPRTGLHFIQVGRVDEVKALLSDIERLVDNGSAVRFIIGEYGSGKTFFLQLIRAIAMEKKLVTVHADMTPDRRLHSTSGHARAFYAELTRNMSVRSKPDGGALSVVVERFVSSAVEEARAAGKKPDTVIRERLERLTEYVGGYDFAEVIAAYWKGHDTGNETLKSDALRWFRGEFSTRTDARKALGVRSIVDDEDVYDQLKLLAQFVRLAGYAGLLVVADELVNLYKMTNTQARNTNYEQILRILNDGLSGSAAGIGFVFAGTPEFLMDPRRGVYSYEALRSRLAKNAFAGEGRVDFTGPVISISNLTPEDLFVLLTKIRHVFANNGSDSALLPDAAIHAFMEHCSKRIGDSYFRTPRNSIKAFADLLAILDQNPGTDWRNLLGNVAITEDSNPDLAPLPDEEEVMNTSATGSAVPPRPSSAAGDDELTSFKL